MLVAVQCGFEAALRCGSRQGLPDVLELFRRGVSACQEQFGRARRLEVDLGTPVELIEAQNTLRCIIDCLVNVEGLDRNRRLVRNIRDIT
jgi:hypothetical protein